MSPIELFHTFASHLIEIMGVGLLVALGFRYALFRAGKRDQIYFNTFSRGVEKLLDSEDKTVEIKNVDGWLSELLEKITRQLPQRTLRAAEESELKGNFRNQPKKEKFADFAEGQKSVVHAFKQNSDTFKSPYPPNFSELTNRILDQDKKWRTIMGIIPVHVVSRVLDILPGLFVIGGIFGTFIGITGALPKIASIDLSRLDEAAPILTAFVSNVAFSMNTSIAGITYSVIMTLLNTLFPVGVVRNSVRKKLERAMEFIWYRIHGNKVSEAERQMIKILAEIRDSLGTEPEKTETRAA